MYVNDFIYTFVYRNAFCMVSLFIKGGAKLVKNRIRQLRKEKDLTLKELSQKLEEKGTPLSASSLIKYERGERNPKLETWIKLADFFNVPVPYLQGKNENEANWENDLKLREDFSNYEAFKKFVQRTNKENDTNGISEANYNLNNYDKETQKSVGRFLINVECLIDIILSLKLTNNNSKKSRIQLFDSMNTFINVINGRIGKKIFDNNLSDDEFFDKAIGKEYSKISSLILNLSGILQSESSDQLIQNITNSSNAIANQLEELEKKIKENPKEQNK